MNVLLVIPDKLLIILAILASLLIVAVWIITKMAYRVEPIGEERYDDDKNLNKEQQEAKDELERVYAQMSSDLEEKAPTKVEDFEKEQEENAIISYQELMAHAEKLKEEADAYIKNQERIQEVKIKEDQVVTRLKNEKSSFKTSEIVSPIYGIEDNKGMLKKKKSPKYEKDDIISEAYEKENAKNLDFLNSLKEFRKNL